MISLDIDVQISRPLAAKLNKDGIKKVTKNAANDLTSLLKNHFIDRAQQTQSRRYWGQAADSTQATHTDSYSQITIAQPGVRLHWRGGMVAPSGKTSEVTGKPIHRLLIPFDDSPMRQRGASLAESGIPQDQIRALKAKTGTIYLAWITPPAGKGRKAKVTPLGALVERTYHDADRTVMPTEKDMKDTITNSVIDTIVNLIR